MVVNLVDAPEKCHPRFATRRSFLTARFFTQIAFCKTCMILAEGQSATSAGLVKNAVDMKAMMKRFAISKRLYEMKPF